MADDKVIDLEEVRRKKNLPEGEYMFPFCDHCSDPANMDFCFLVPLALMDPAGAIIRLADLPRL